MPSNNRSVRNHYLETKKQMLGLSDSSFTHLLAAKGLVWHHRGDLYHRDNYMEIRLSSFTFPLMQQTVSFEMKYPIIVFLVDR